MLKSLELKSKLKTTQNTQKTSNIDVHQKNKEQQNGKTYYIQPDYTMLKNVKR